jgi:ketosteroid isomerase-like protein
MSGQQIIGSAGAVVQQVLDAVAALDADRLAPLIHDDVEVIEPSSLPYGGTYRGKQAFFEELFPALTGPFEMGTEDVVLLEGATAAASRMTVLFTSRRTGRTIRMPYVEVYEVADAQVRKLEVFPQDVTALTAFMEAER